MSAAVVEQSGDLLRDRPPLDAPDGERLLWLIRKADVLAAIATQAAEEPGLVDLVGARRAAAAARAQDAGLRALIGDPQAYLAHVDVARSGS